MHFFTPTRYRPAVAFACNPRIIAAAAAAAIRCWGFGLGFHRNP
ncbi:hypothetical protein DDI_2157 [Dickeya dianthicola RNS04.9]|nr:hypothetical protein DDI_2157 [Dickeya dianthicola RNS04.9]